MMLQLTSVNSVIDTETGIVYPFFENGKWDKVRGIHFQECTKDWVDALSDHDVTAINEATGFNDFK